MPLCDVVEDLLGHRGTQTTEVLGANIIAVMVVCNSGSGNGNRIEIMILFGAGF